MKKSATALFLSNVVCLSYTTILSLTLIEMLYMPLKVSANKEYGQEFDSLIQVTP
jgi:hypothetical protein